MWGLVGGSTLVVGAVLGLFRDWSSRVIGLVMAFGAGVLIASVAYELVDDAAHEGTFGATAAGLAVGSLTFFVGDVLIERAGARDRKLSTAPAAGAAAASGTALALGALLDGIPESAAIGVTFLEGRCAQPGVHRRGGAVEPARGVVVVHGHARRRALRALDHRACGWGSRWCPGWRRGSGSCFLDGASDERSWRS